jgi:hypothetical protein
MKMILSWLNLVKRFQSLNLKAAMLKNQTMMAQNLEENQRFKKMTFSITWSNMGRK